MANDPEATTENLNQSQQATPDAVTVAGELPVPISIFDGKKVLKLKKVTMRQLTIGELLDSQASAKPNEFLSIVEIAASIEMEDGAGKKHSITYDALLKSSQQNLNYLTDLKMQLNAKEQAES